MTAGRREPQGGGGRCVTARRVTTGRPHSHRAPRAAAAAAPRLPPAAGGDVQPSALQVLLRAYPRVVRREGQEKRSAPFLGVWRGRGAAAAAELSRRPRLGGWVARAAPVSAVRGGRQAPGRARGGVCAAELLSERAAEGLAKPCGCPSEALRLPPPRQARGPYPHGRLRFCRAVRGGCGGRKALAARDVKHRINAQPVLGAKTRKEGRGEGRWTRKGKGGKRSERPLKTEEKKT